MRMGPTQTCSQGVLDRVFYSIWSFPSASILFFFFFLIRKRSFSSDEGKVFFQKFKPLFLWARILMVEIISIKPCAPELAYISGPILRIVTKFRNDPHEERFQCTVTIHAGEESWKLCSVASCENSFFQPPGKLVS